MNPVMAEIYPGNEAPPYSASRVVLDSSHPLHPLTELRPEIIDPLLNRCLELGLLTPWRLGSQAVDAAWHIHPAFASYLSQVFRENFAPMDGSVGHQVAYCFAGSFA